MTSITSVSQADDDDDIFVCGYNSPTGATDPDSNMINYKAVMARMDNDGDVSWIISATGRNPDSASADQDKCVGISYNKYEDQIAVLIQGKMSEVRGD